MPTHHNNILQSARAMPFFQRLITALALTTVGWMGKSHAFLTHGGKLSRKVSGVISSAPKNIRCLHPQFCVRSTCAGVPRRRKTRASVSSSSIDLEAVKTAKVDGRSPPNIITCSSSKELAHAVNTFVQPHHVVAELGAQLRDVSETICDQCQHAVLVDVKREVPKSIKTGKSEKSAAVHEDRRTQAMRLMTVDAAKHDLPLRSNAKFVELDNLQDWRRAFFAPPIQREGETDNLVLGYDILVLDMNSIVGNDLEWAALALILEFEAMCRMTAQQSPDARSLKYVLVKSLGLNQFASKLTYTRPWLEQAGQHVPAASKGTTIIATVGVQEYRSTIPTVVQKESFVLEVGCHFGTSTVMLQDHAMHCIGVDVGSKIIREAQRKHPRTFFCVGDAWKTAELLRLQHDYYDSEIYMKSAGQDGINTAQSRQVGFDVVYVDVGGLSGSDGLLDTIALISSLKFALEPRYIVIKSLCLQRLSARLHAYWKWQKTHLRNDHNVL
jgi:hypothetical protein